MDTAKIDPIDKMFRYLGLLLTVASCALTYAWASTFKIHWLVDFVLPFGLVGAAVASAYAWPKVLDRVKSHGWVAAAPVVAFATLFTATDVISNFGSVAWQRTVDMDAASTQNARYDDSRNAIKDNEKLLGIMTKQLEDLQTREKWSASANATAMRAQLVELQAASDREAARGGCGPKCEAIKRDVITLQSRIGAVERRDSLAARIEATKATLAKLRASAGKVEKAQSGAALSTVSFASMFTLSRNPDESAMHWTDKGLSWLVAAFFTFGAMGCNLLGWGNLAGMRREAIVSGNSGPHGGRKTSPEPEIVARGTVPLQPRSSSLNLAISDSRDLDSLKSVLTRALAQQQAA